MRFLLKLLLYPIVFFELLVFFAPKVNLYYWGETFLQTRNVFISDEVIEDSGWQLNLSSAELFFDKLSLARLDVVTLSPWLLYNTLKVEGIHIDEGFTDFMPLEVKTLEVTYAVYNPMKITMNGESDSGYFNGEVNLLERQVSIRLFATDKAQKRYANALARLKKSGEGYVYEYRF